MSEGYGEGRPDVEAMMRRGSRSERPTRRTRPVPAARPERLTRPRARPAQAKAPAVPQYRTKISVGESPVIPVVMLGTGMYLCWFAIHYWRSDLKYPTDPVKAILQGKGLPANTKTPTVDEQAVLTAAQAQAVVGGGSVAATSTPGVSAPGALNATAQANINTGKLLAAGYGWGPGTADWACLQSGWQEESGWNQHAAYDHADPYNHAYGIPQANPGTKMASAGPNWKDDPTTQIRWGLAYIKATYGSPSRVPGWTASGPAAGYVGY